MQSQPRHQLRQQHDPQGDSHGFAHSHRHRDDRHMQFSTHIDLRHRLRTEGGCYDISFILCVTRFRPRTTRVTVYDEPLA